VVRRVLIVGGTRGIGLAVAKAFRDAGDEVVQASRHPEASNEPGMARWQLDLTRPEGIRTLLGSGPFARPFEVVVNTAGVLLPDEPSIYRGILATNLLGALALTEFLAPRMNDGTILHFSGGGVGGSNHQAPPFYTVTKAALVTWIECVASRYPRVTLNAIAPGRVATQMSPDGGTPDRAARLALWLASPEARHLTGRLFSAQWDDIERLKAPVGDNDYRLRRQVPA
jgi:NAD(P)-dependent dehydrogenase (short-subunit alcohol dehydrogenase family)